MRLFVSKAKLKRALRQQRATYGARYAAKQVERAMKGKAHGKAR